MGSRFASDIRGLPGTRDDVRDSLFCFLVALAQPALAATNLAK